MSETENFKIQKSEQYYVDVVSAMAERTIRRLWITILALIVLLVGTNAGWLWYESQFEDVSITAEQTADGESNNYAIGGDYYGSETEGDNYKTSP